MNCKSKWCDVEIDEDSPSEYCPECEEARAMSKMKVPEGGWPKNSQADRL